jgi:2Fe-2S iron-sulfur cluster binding domain
MKVIFGFATLLLLTATLASGFMTPSPLLKNKVKLYVTVPSSVSSSSNENQKQQQIEEMSISSSDEDEDLLNTKLQLIASNLRLQVYDPTTSVYGFDARDRFHGIENVRVSLDIEPSLGLDLTELAHSSSKYDSRGLVLVSGVSGNAAAAQSKTGQHRIHTGDTIIGVFVGDEFKESTTALNFEETMAVLQEAKEYAKEHGIKQIDLELNRLVRREPVKVVIEEDWRDAGHDVHAPPHVATEIEGLAGDNLRSLLMHRHLRLYDDRTVRLDTLGTGDCGGEGICGTCLVEVLEGMETLNPKGPQEVESKLKLMHTGRREIICTFFWMMDDA